MKKRLKILTHRNCFKIGDRVVDIPTVERPAIFSRLHGTIIRAYQESSEHLGFYEVYEVQWDSGKVERGFFAHGIEPEPTEVVDAEKGMSILQAARATVEQAKNQRKSFTLRFNHHEFYISPISTVDEVLEAFYHRSR